VGSLPNGDPAAVVRLPSREVRVPSHSRERHSKGSTMLASRKLTDMSCLVAVLAMALAPCDAAMSEEHLIRKVEIWQVWESSTNQKSPTSEATKRYELACDGTICTGRLSLTLVHESYDYDVVVIIMTYDRGSINVNTNLRPTNTICDPRCAEPRLNAVSTTLPWARHAQVTIALKQYGDPLPTAPGDSTADLVYRVLIDPVAYCDLSIEFE
jgi:hypothetical protein